MYISRYTSEGGGGDQGTIVGGYGKGFGGGRRGGPGGAGGCNRQTMDTCIVMYASNDVSRSAVSSSVYIHY